jgi:hypothetical protein
MTPQRTSCWAPDVPALTTRLICCSTASRALSNGSTRLQVPAGPRPTPLRAKSVPCLYQRSGLIRLRGGRMARHPTKDA